MKYNKKHNTSSARNNTNTNSNNRNKKQQETIKIPNTSFGRFEFGRRRTRSVKNSGFIFDCQRCIRKANPELNSKYEQYIRQTMKRKNKSKKEHKKRSRIMVRWTWMDNKTSMTICNGCYGKLLSLDKENGKDYLFENSEPMSHHGCTNSNK